MVDDNLGIVLRTPLLPCKPARTTRLIVRKLHDNRASVPDILSYIQTLPAE